MMGLSRKQKIGRWGERVAEDFLLRHGCSIVNRNVRTPYGEIDLIVLSTCLMIFVEVKTRTNLSYGNPETAVTETKLQHMVEAAQYYLQQSPQQDVDWRIDVIAIFGTPGPHTPQISWFKNVIQ